jgi:hypothetical protein
VRALGGRKGRARDGAGEGAVKARFQSFKVSQGFKVEGHEQVQNRPRNGLATAAHSPHSKFKLSTFRISNWRGNPLTA